MRIKAIELRGVKSFGSARVDFSEDVNLFTFSGANGAGKSTLMRAAWLVQKAHFLRIYNDPAMDALLDIEVGRYLHSADSWIRLLLEVTDEVGETVDAAIRLEMRDDKWDLVYDRHDLVVRSWNLANPTNIILFIDASKSFSEETLSYDALSIASNDRAGVVLQAILNPEYLFSGIYRQLIRDYVHNRLVPSTPDRTLYFNVSKAMFSTLLPDVEISNFSGNHTKNEFVLLGKARRGSSKSSPYDVREFSSGEKALFATLTFLCISRSVAILVVDEPENHFHDSLLMEFIAMMQSLTVENGVVAWVDAYNKSVLAAGANSRVLKRDWIAGEYKDHRLRQIILATHSRSLIYKSFSLGQNIAVSDAIRPIVYDEAEATLRSLGLSTTISRMLLVEGETDSAALNFFLAGHNAQIMPLTGSDAVIETFRRLSRIHGNLNEFHFVFLVDSDNKPQQYLDDLRAINRPFFDASFVRLPVHEFENLLLDASVFTFVLEQYAAIHGGTALSEPEVSKRLVDLARDAVPQTVAKEMANEVRLELLNYFGNAVWAKMPSTDIASEVQGRISVALDAAAVNTLRDDLHALAADVEARYVGLAPDELLRRCDGKRVFRQACGEFAKIAGVAIGKFEAAVYMRAKESPGAALKDVLADLATRLGVELMP